MAALSPPPRTLRGGGHVQEEPRLLLATDSRRHAVDFLRHCAQNLPPRAFAYLDPPYYVKGQQRLYANYYSDADHATIAGILPSLTFPWVVSYDAAPQIRQLYRRYRRTSYSLRYTAAQRRRGAEVIFFSDGLVVPKGTWPSQGRHVGSPARIATR